MALLLKIQRAARAAVVKLSNCRRFTLARLWCNDGGRSRRTGKGKGMYYGRGTPNRKAAAALYGHGRIDTPPVPGPPLLVSVTPVLIVMGSEMFKVAPTADVECSVTGDRQRQVDFL